MKRFHPALLLFATLIVAASSSLATSIISRQYTPPAFYGDLLLFSQRTGSKLYAIDRATKRDVWVWSCGGRNVRTTPTVAGDVAYIWAGSSCTDSRACAIDCRSGRSIWETPTEGWTFDHARLVENVVLFPVESETDEVQAFERATGKKLWKKEHVRLLLVHGRELLVSRNRDKELALLDAITGEEVFSCPFSAAEFVEPQADCSASGIAVAGCEGLVLAVDIPNRKVLWRVDTGKRKLIPAFSGDSLFLITGWSMGNTDGGQALEKWNLSSGTRESIFLIQATCHTYEKPAIFDTVVAVASNGQLIGLERETGKELWKVPIGGSYGTCQTADSIFVGENGPRLEEFDARTGKRLWVYEVDRPQDVEHHPPGSEGSGSGGAPLVGRDGMVLILWLCGIGAVLLIVGMLWWKRR